jgi:plastocyanin domain-containing protein
MKNRIVMLQNITFFGTLASFGFLLVAISGAIATETNEPQRATKFQPITQPIENKIAVTLGGLGLIGAELWWFVLSKPKPRQASTQAGVQEVTVTVDGGYEPSQIVGLWPSKPKIKMKRTTFYTKFFASLSSA